MEGRARFTGREYGNRFSPAPKYSLVSVYKESASLEGDVWAPLARSEMDHGFSEVINESSAPSNDSTRVSQSVPDRISQREAINHLNCLSQ